MQDPTLSRSARPERRPAPRTASATFAAALALAFAAPAALAAPVAPQLSGSTYAFAFPDNGPRLVVDPAPGGRVTSLKLGNTEFLYLNQANNNLLWGSVFWTAPQAAWNWPPPAAHNLNPYTAGVKGNALVLVGGVDNASKFALVKGFSAETADTSIRIEYTIKNTGTAARSAAPWAITRVLPGGLTFWGKGPGPMRGQLAAMVKEQGGWVWFDHAANPGTSGDIPKVFADGKGWLAHLEPGGMLQLAVFPDIAQSEAAPEEAEIEIYTAPGRTLMEIEHQGAYASIRAGDSTTYAIRWYIRRIPASAQKAVGDAGLVAFVQSLLDRSPTGLAGAADGRGDSRGAASSGRGVRDHDFGTRGLQFRDRKDRPVDAQGRLVPPVKSE